MSLFKKLFSSPSVNDCDWYCDSCDAHLNRQIGFTTTCGTWTCTNCGSDNNITEDDILSEEEAEYQESLQMECPKCGGHMAREGYSFNSWKCEDCGCEAQSDDYGLLWFED